MLREIKTAQHLIKANSSVMAGFNMFIHGHGEITFADGYHDAYERMQGYEYAKKMAKEEGIAFTHPFKCEKSGCFPFQYGGFFVCNSCGKKGVLTNSLILGNCLFWVTSRTPTAMHDVKKIKKPSMLILQTYWVFKNTFGVVTVQFSTFKH